MIRRTRWPRVVIVGGGFGGLAAAKALRDAPVEVTLVDRRNFHLFQPLLYQVATGALSPGEIAAPLRGVLKRQANAEVVMAEVTGFDLRQRRIRLGQQANEQPSGWLSYDYLIVAAGARHSYFGREEWEGHAPGMKTIEQALRIRRRMLEAFEAAEIEPDPEKRRAWLNFVVIGGGPTGVEVAGQIAEIARHTLRDDFRRINPAETRVMLVEAGERVLAPYRPELSLKARRSLEHLGVTPVTSARVTAIDPESVTITPREGDPVRVLARTKVWAAGVEASPLAGLLARATGAELDRAGRVTVAPDLSLPGHPEVLAIGDMNRVADGHGGTQPWPGLAQPAIQQGRYAASVVRAKVSGTNVPAAFDYQDKGTMATIGRRRAIAEINGHGFSGTLAWLAWLVIHVFTLVGLQNKLIVLTRWSLSFITHGRGHRLMTGDAVAADYERTIAAPAVADPACSGASSPSNPL